MKILFVAATKNEIAELQKYIVAEKLENRAEILITGMGILQACFFLHQKLIQNSYNLVVNAGIAGSYLPEIEIGSLIQVYSESLGDVAYESPGGHKSFFGSKFMDENTFPFENGKINCPYYLLDVKLRKAIGISVNLVAGTPSTISFRKTFFNAEVESMEGIAIFFVCKLLQIPFIEIRTISNMIEERSKQTWNIPLACKNLNNFLIDLLINLNQKKWTFEQKK